MFHEFSLVKVIMDFTVKTDFLWWDKIIVYMMSVFSETNNEFVRPNKKMSVFWVMGSKILGRIGHFFSGKRVI